MIKLKIFIFLLMALVLLTSSCRVAREAGGDYISGTSAGDAETLNWILAADAASFSYSGHTLDSLVTYDNEWRIQLRLAARDVEVSGDGLVYSVTIRDDLKWSDGSKVLYTTPPDGSPGSYLYRARFDPLSQIHRD
ncbi:MAG: hypothetical protein HYY80_02135 [Chloroflexi bacterium]|nr:hypothetical protein [Chloroflexota bacterium]